MARSASVEWSVKSCAPARPPFLPPVSRGLVSLCQKWNAAAAGYTNALSTLPWVPVLECQAFRNLLVLRFKRSHDQHSLQVLCRRSWLQMTSFDRIPKPWSCAFDCRIQYTASWSYFQRVTLGAFCGTVKSSWSYSSSRSFPNGFVAVRKTARRALPFSFPPGIRPFPNVEWKFHESPLWNKYLVQFRGIDTQPTHWIRLYWNTTRMPLNSS